MDKVKVPPAQSLNEYSVCSEATETAAGKHGKCHGARDPSGTLTDPLLTVQGSLVTWRVHSSAPSDGRIPVCHFRRILN